MTTKKDLQFSGFFILIFSFLLISCGKHMYIMKINELVNYAESAREPGYESFVVYEIDYGLDTLKGKDLDQKSKKGQKYWYMDDKGITMKGVKSYQDQYAYYERRNVGVTGPIDFVRIIKGKASLFYHQVHEPNSMTMKTLGTTTTSFYMGERGVIQLITLNSLKSEMASCSQAIQKVEEEFNKTPWTKHPDDGINDYRALVRIFDVYNNCN